jgi:hypothetical protein
MITTGSCAPEEEKPEAPPCTASWSCTNWGDCTNGIQRRDCTCSCADNNCAGDSSESKPCPVPGGNQTGPTGAASGVQGGQPSGGSQSLPELEKPKPQSDSSIWLYLGVVLVILLGALLLWRNSRKPRKRK